MKEQEFNKQASIYQVVHAFIVNNVKTFDGKDSKQLSKAYVRNFITRRSILLNGFATYNATKKVNNGNLVEIPQFKIVFKCARNPDYIDFIQEEQAPQVEMVSQVEKPSLDEYISSRLNRDLGLKSISELNTLDTKRVFSWIVKFYQEKSFDEVRESSFTFDLAGYLQSKLKDFPNNEFQIPKTQISFGGKVVELLIQRKIEQESKLKILVNELIQGLYKSTLFKFLSEYSRVVNFIQFQYLVNPLLNPDISSRAAIERLIKVINDSLQINNREEKFSHFDSNKAHFESYIKLTKSDGNPYSREIFEPLGKYLFDLLKEICETNTTKHASIDIEVTKRKYNFHSQNRPLIDLYINIFNNGDGLAKSIRFECSTSNIKIEEFSDVGLLYPGQSREVTLKTRYLTEAKLGPELSIRVFYQNLEGSENSKNFILKFNEQKDNVPWDSLNKLNPYSIQVIENKDKLFGREDILKELKLNILSNNIESYKLWGQKRVGKSSIVKVLKTIFDDEPNVLVVYRSLGGIRNANPEITLNDLGDSLSVEILDEIERKIQNQTVRDAIKSIEIPTFNGSLNPLQNFIRKINKVDPSLKIVFILDEFDRINDAFFNPGNLGETLSLSIGKGLNEYKNIGFILVGSENMQLLDRQGINYNSYREKEVDTFNKETEYQSFKEIITGPVHPYITYSEEAIDEVFNFTNGNPYFTNLICFNAFKNAYKNLDSDIDIHSIGNAINEIINSSQKSHFEHFWGDGLTDESVTKREKKIDTRRRLLVSYSMSFQKEGNSYPTRNELIKNFKYPQEYEIQPFEVDNAITEFYNRKIFIEHNINQIRILPLLFEKWLCGPGKTLMVEGVSDLEALHRENELELQMAIKQDELKSLSEKLVISGKKISIETFKSYLAQFGGHSDQRKIYKLLDQIVFISQDEITEFYKKNIRNIFGKREIKLAPNVHSYKREGVEVYTFNKRFSENRFLSETFKIIANIRSTKTTKNVRDDSLAWKKSESQDVVIYRAVIDEVTEFEQELTDFLSSEVKDANVSITILALLVTTKAKVSLVKLLSGFNNVKLVVFKELEAVKIKPFVEGSEIFETQDEANQSFSVVRKLFPLTPIDSNLVVFESQCPSSSVPILWSGSSKFKPLFPNTFENFEPDSTTHDAEKLRTRLYHANVKFSQAVNLYIVNHLKRKAMNDKMEDWFNVKYIPKSVMTTVHTKWVSDNQKAPIETYFEFLDYKKVIESNPELVPLFQVPGESLSWLEKLNDLRRDPAHPEKPAPEENEVLHFEKVMNLILPKIKNNNAN